MFEHFTEAAIEVIMYAQDESRRLGHNIVGTELLFLALVRQESGVAAKVLKVMGVELDNVRTEVEKFIGRGCGLVPVEIPFTSNAKHILELSLEESRQLGYSYIDTEHLLLGLIRQEEDALTRVLENLGVDRREVRNQVIRELSTEMEVTVESNLSVVAMSANIEQQIQQLSTKLATAKDMISEIEREIKVRLVSVEEVANTINQLPDASEFDKPGIKELLTQLQAAIKADSNLNTEDKDEAFEQLIVLAEVVNSPQDKRMQKIARTALKILKGTVAELPHTSELVQECKQILPAIAKAFSL